MKYTIRFLRVIEPGKDYIMIRLIVYKIQYRLLDNRAMRRLEKIDKLKEKIADDVDRRHELYKKIQIEKEWL